MTIKVYRDEDANAAIIETGSDGSIGMRFNNEMKAIGNGDGTCTIMNPPKSTDNEDFAELANIAYTEFVDEQGNALGADEASTCNALNAILRQTGSSTGAAPVITSATSITVSDGDAINYSLTATGGVGYEWSNIPAGMSIANGNPRNLIGTITDGAGVYTPTMTATNYYGQDTETLSITVTSSFANTKSIKFNNNDYLAATASSSNPLYRASNGSGSGDAWTIHAWFKGGTNAGAEQTILSFGGNDDDNEGRVHLYWDNSNGDKFIVLEYGTNNNNITLRTPDDSLTAGSWKHILVTYDGGTTGSASGSVNDYYGRFEIWIDGVSQTLTNSNSNYGFSNGITADVFKIGEACFGGKHLKNNSFVDEVALWASDETANVAGIYNSGTPHDLSALGSAPDHWWRMGDGDTYPVIQDNAGSANFAMFNMTAADIVNDVP